MQNEGDFEDIALLVIISVTKVVMSQKHKIQVRRITLYLKQMICVTIRRQLFFFWSFERKTYTWRSRKNSHS